MVVVVASVETSIMEKVAQGVECIPMVKIVAFTVLEEEKHL